MLPSTVLFDYPSAEALCGYILATQQALAAAVAAATDGPSRPGSRRGSGMLRRMSAGPGGLGMGLLASANGSRRGSGIGIGGGRPGAAVLMQAAVAARRITAQHRERRRTTGLAPLGHRPTADSTNRRLTAQHSMFAHGQLAVMPLDGRRVTVLPHPGSAAVPTLQVVTITAAALRMGAASTAPPTGAALSAPAPGFGLRVFSSDMVGTVPLSRWDVERQRELEAQGAGPLHPRFGGYLEGGWTNVACCRCCCQL